MKNDHHRSIQSDVKKKNVFSIFICLFIFSNFQNKIFCWFYLLHFFRIFLTEKKKVEKERKTAALVVEKQIDSDIIGGTQACRDEE